MTYDAVFAIPGDMYRRTGGFIYEARLLDALRDAGLNMQHLQLPDSFPDPTPQDMALTRAALLAIPRGTPVILDGFVSGTIDPAILREMIAPVIAMVHHPLGLETGLAPDRAATLLQSERNALSCVDHVIVPSPHTKSILVQDFTVPAEHITIALPGFDPVTTVGQPEAPPLILSIGLLAPRKGHDVFLDALAMLSDLSWSAEIIGGIHDQDYATLLEGKRQKEALEHRVQFLGEVDGTVINARFSAATIFALATRYEGYGMVFSEAMLHALPIVACDVGAVIDTVGNAGILTPVDNPKAFADALRLLLTDITTRQRISDISRLAGRSLPSWRDTAKHAMSAINAAKGLG